MVFIEESHDTPFQLDGVLKTDFRAILKLLYPLYVQRVLLVSRAEKFKGLMIQISEYNALTERVGVRSQTGNEMEHARIP